MRFKVLIYSWKHNTQFKKSFVLTTSITIGINLWFAPQISEHWPKYSPGRWAINLTWLSRPGTASAFTPKDGTVQECKTSADEIKTRIWVLKGTTVRLSTSNKRKCLISNSVSGIIYASNSTAESDPILQKSVYSYLQYHWCPSALIVNDASIESSSIYNKSKEGIAICTRITAGTIVHTHSIICLSSSVLFIKELYTMVIIITITNVIINISTILIKSCKKINSSIIGELASCSPNWLQVIIYLLICTNSFKNTINPCISVLDTN